MSPELLERILELAVQIQQIPAPTLSEARRAAFVREQFVSEGLADVSMDEAGNVWGRLPGQGTALPVVVSAHLDTVFPESTDLSLKREAERIYAPGIGDNSLGVAGLLGLIWTLRQKAVPGDGSLPGDLWLAANVAEEGMGNLRGMCAVVDRFGGQVQAYLILEGMALGQVYHRGLGVQRYQITVKTSGGHSWVDFGRPSAVHELAALVTRLAGIPLPERPRTTLNVGTICGGTSVNTIAPEASILVDLRSESPQALAGLAAKLEALAVSVRRPGVQVLIDVVGQRPAGEIPSDHPLVRLSQRSLEVSGVQPALNIGSTDANVPLSRGYPAVCLGLTTGGEAHTIGEYILTAPLERGMNALQMVVEGVYLNIPRRPAGWVG